MPKTYGTRVRNMLLASPESVDFRSLSGYYYEFGVKLIEFLIDDQLPHIIDKVSYNNAFAFCMYSYLRSFFYVCVYIGI